MRPACLRCCVLCYTCRAQNALSAVLASDCLKLGVELALDKSTVPEQQVAIKFIERGEKVRCYSQ